MRLPHRKSWSKTSFLNTKSTDISSCAYTANKLINFCKLKHSHKNMTPQCCPQFSLCKLALSLPHLCIPSITNVIFLNFIIGLMYFLNRFCTPTTSTKNAHASTTYPQIKTHGDIITYQEMMKTSNSLDHLYIL